MSWIRVTGHCCNVFFLKLLSCGAKSLTPIFRFKVMNDAFGKDTILGWSCIRLDRLREGYRILHLLSADGARSDAIMLVKIYKGVK